MKRLAIAIAVVVLTYGGLRIIGFAFGTTAMQYAAITLIVAGIIALLAKGIKR